MQNANIIYTTAVLSRLAGTDSSVLKDLSEVVIELHEIDFKLLTYFEDEIRRGLDRANDIEVLIAKGKAHLCSLPIIAELEFGMKRVDRAGCLLNGHLSILIPHTSWDMSNPLYLSGSKRGSPTPASVFANHKS